ncbi:MAG: prolipoprotein diacylglyceryl transferase, partial [Anaerolineae bacterium]|nr:prolipoprotein diacylglyceryl transferase [Anaerolineae bacterium]
MEFSRTGIEFGPFDIFGTTLNPTLHFYGLLIVIGILAGTSLTAWLSKREGKNPEHVWNGMMWAVALGVIGARLWFVFFPPVATAEAGKDTAWMLKNFFDLNDGAIAIWSGGLGIFGAVIGGFIGVLIYVFRAKLTDLWVWIDMAAIGLPLGHAIGRWGNYVNQELYGKPTDLPWAISIDNPPAKYADAAGFHPLFLYESLWNLALCGFLLWLWFNYRSRLYKGDFLLIYLMGYAPIRFMLEFLRVEIAEVPGLGINSSQAITAIAFAAAAAVFIYRHQFAEVPAAQYYDEDALREHKGPSERKRKSQRKR